MRKDLYSMKTQMRWLPLLLLLCAGVQMPSYSQAPTILSAEGAPLIFELPLDASTTQNLSASTAIRLATPDQHAAQGMTYPLWLSDASFHIRNRSQQRLAIVVTPKRGNPELSTELLLTLNNAGRRSFRPLHLMFDTVSRFAGEPLPMVATILSPAADKPDVHNSSAPVIRFETQAVPTPVPEQPQLLSNRTEPNLPATRKPRFDAPRYAPNNVAAPTASNTLPASQASSPLPATTISTPASPTTPQTPAPARAAKPLPPPVVAASGLESWLTNWTMLAAGLAIALLLLYLLARVFKKWYAQRANQLPTTFLDPKPTAISAEESSISTVFGMNEEEANAMHAKWLREQTTKRS